MRRYDREQRWATKDGQGHWAVCAIDGDAPEILEVCDTREEAERCRKERIVYLVDAIEQSQHEGTGAVWTDRYRAYLRKEFERRIVVAYQYADGRLENIEMIHEPLFGFSENDPEDQDADCDGDCEHCDAFDDLDDDSEDDEDEDDDDEDYELTEEDIDSEYWIVCDISVDGPRLIKILYCEEAAEAYRERFIAATLDSMEEAATTRRLYIWTEEYRQYLQTEFERRIAVVSETDFRDNNVELVTDPIYGPQELRISGTNPDGSTWTC